jgi:hypothetical protein
MFETRMLGYTELQLDTATSVLMGLLNGLAVIRHEAAAGPEIIDLFLRAGIAVEESLHTYQTEADAVACANQLIRAGHLLFWPYPLPAGRYQDAAHLVSPHLYRYLNAKENLAQWLPPEHLARRHILSHEQMAACDFSEPVCLKAAGNAATGWGYAVFPCLNKEHFTKAKAWFVERSQDIPAVLVEEWIEVDCCWCAGLAIDETSTLCFGGAEQLFSSPGKQSGSIIDPERPFTAKARQLAVRVGELARGMGFRGIAGLDIGRAKDGRYLVFDPNFRIASSSSQLLFHEAASVRSGLPVSQSFQSSPCAPFDEIAKRLHQPIEEGWFVPTRLFNGEKHPLSDGKHIITGFVMAADRDLATEAAKRLQQRLL